MSNIIATEILQQLGGNKFIMMTGAKNLAASENALHCKVMKGMYLVITLNGLDLYDIDVFKMRNCQRIKEKKSTGIYNDMLVKEVESLTGLYLSL